MYIYIYVYIHLYTYIHIYGRICNWEIATHDGIGLFITPACSQASAASLPNQSPLEMCSARPLTQGPPIASTRSGKQSESDDATKLLYTSHMSENIALSQNG